MRETTPEIDLESEEAALDKESNEKTHTTKQVSKVHGLSYDKILTSDSKGPTASAKIITTVSVSNLGA